MHLFAALCDSTIIGLGSNVVCTCAGRFYAIKVLLKASLVY